MEDEGIHIHKQLSNFSNVGNERIYNKGIDRLRSPERSPDLIRSSPAGHHFGIKEGFHHCY